MRELKLKQFILSNLSGGDSSLILRLLYSEVEREMSPIGFMFIFSIFLIMFFNSKFAVSCIRQ